MYNINFNVKYFNIEQELLAKNEHTKEDIGCICEHLYTHELSSVFYAESIIDDKIDKGLEDITEILYENLNFVSLANEIKGILYLNENDDYETYVRNSNYIVILASFSYPVFHIMHKCIVQQLTNKSIEQKLLDELKICLENYILSKK